MTIHDKIREEQLQYYISRGAGNTLALSSGKINKYDILQVKKYYLLIKN